MAEHHPHPHTHSERKCCAIARNKYHHIVNLMAWQHESVAAGAMLSAPAAGDNEPVAMRDEEGNLSWVERGALIRNRLSGKKRKAKDRWNRFAGTSGGGGRGR